MLQLKYTNIKIFTYKEYCKCIKIFAGKEKYKFNGNLILKEENENYKYTPSKEVNNEHDKIFRKILDNKKEAANCINKVLGESYKVEPKEIEQYNSSYITEVLKNKECDIVYKLKNKNIFFLIEHQTKVDYSMPYRILEYEYYIIKSAIDIHKLGRKEYKLPVVIAIVIYTGKEKWSVSKYLNEMQNKIPGYSKVQLGNYNLIDINNYSEKELLEENSFLSKAMLIEKSRYSSRLAKNLELIVDEINNKTNLYESSQKELLSTIISLTLKRKLSLEDIQNLNNKLKIEGGKEMLAVLDMIDEENRRLIARGEKRGRKLGIKEGIEKSRTEIIINMIKENIPIKTIEKITGLSKEEIEKIAKK